MTDCIRSLLNKCNYLKYFLLSITLKDIFFQLSPMHFSGEPDLQGQRLKYLSEKFTNKIMHMFRKHKSLDI